MRTFKHARLAELRVARRLDQTSLALALRDRGHGTTQAQVSRWENGRSPDTRVVGDLATVLGVSVDELFADDEDEATP